jgi:predicted amidohydrolase
LSVRVRLAQIAPILGDLDANLALHLEAIERARAEGIELLVFPELSLTGYFLRDLTEDLALRLDDSKLAPLRDAARGISVVCGLVEEGSGHRFYNSALFLEDGALLHCHRKVYLPTYGLFEEARYFAAGRSWRPVRSRLGRFGISICEDSWHFTSGFLYFLDDCDALICPSAAPGRGVSEEGAEVSSARAWSHLLIAQSMFFQTYALYCNRVGFEDGVLFSGGSRVLTPFGRPAAQAEGLDPANVDAELDFDALRRARVFSPLRRSERPLLFARELERRLDDDADPAAER